MQKWQRERNYRKRRSEDGIWTYLIEIDGTEVEVTKEVYDAYAAYDRRERYQVERDTGRLLSLERLDDGTGGPPLVRPEKRSVESAESIALQEMDFGLVRTALESLSVNDQRLVEALVIDGMTEREYAAEIGMSQKGVNKRKHRALEKIFEFLVLKQPGFREGK
jgi:RNA polymerase sigma factor (sigma-70 family)